jgi:general secretion pathway protein D
MLISTPSTRSEHPAVRKIDVPTWGGRLGRRAIVGLLGLVWLSWMASAVGQEQPQTPPTQELRPGQFVQRSQESATSGVDFETDKAFSATFAGADVGTVIYQILGEFLNIDYSIAPDVSGLVTMRVEELRSRLAAIDALRTALRPLGIAVIDRGDFVAVVKASAQDSSVKAAAIEPGQPSPPGGGVVVLTPRFLAPSQLAPLITPFAPSATVPLADDARRFLIIRGDEAAITAASSAAAMFDVDWFAQVSTASFVLKHISPDDMIGELRPLLGPAAGTIDFIPMPRLSTLIVLARNPQVLTPVRSWIERLDVPNAEISPGLLIYRAKNVSADTLAASIKEAGGAPASPAQVLVTGGASSPTLPGQSTPSPQIPVPTSPDESISVSTNLAQNMVIVRGDSDQLADAKRLLDALDQQIPQVLIEAAIVEVTLDDELQYGINWHGIEERFIGTFTDAPSGLVTSKFPGFSLSYVNTDIEAALNLLASVTKVEVISRPSLMALNNETATLQVGDQVPIVTQTAVSVTDPDAPIVNQTTYRDTGVILTVVPRVRAGGMIELEVAQEVSQVARTTSSGIDSPTIQQRKIESTLLVPSGESVALGGLISTSRSGSVIGIPILKDIPLLGQLFRSDSRIVERTELIVFMTPRVLVDGRAAVEATDQLREAFRKLEQKLGRK